MRQIERWTRRGALLVFLLLVTAQLAVAAPSAHEAPDGSEWIMADWMFLSFVIFTSTAFVAFIVALKAGLLSNLDAATYHVLEIEEQDYYTPDWAREGGEL